MKAMRFVVLTAAAATWSKKAPEKGYYSVVAVAGRPFDHRSLCLCTTRSSSWKWGLTLSVEAEQNEGSKAEEGREGGETVIQVHDEGRWQLVPVCYLAAAALTYTKDVRNTWRLITPCVLYSLAEEVVLLLAASIAYGDHRQMWSGWLALYLR